MKDVLDQKKIETFPDSSKRDISAAPLTVLSLFDGISAGQLALERAGIPVKTYYSSEIDKYAINVTQKNYPETIQLGDIIKWRNWNIDFSKIDILLAGFPCQAWSVAGKQQGDKDPRGELVHHLIGIMKKIQRENPDLIFLFENVKMKKEFISYINGLFGYEPILINSSLLSAQNRERLYWTNIPRVKQPKDKVIFLKEIVFEKTNPDFDIESLKVPIDKSFVILDKEVERGKVGYFRKDCQVNRVYYVHGKAVTLCGEAGGGAAKMGQYLFGCHTPDWIEKRQNGQRFSIGDKSYTLTAQDKHGILTEGYIRKLHPIECERLQTFPDGWTEKGVDIYYLNIIQLIKLVMNGDNECKNVKLRDVIAKYQTDPRDYATNITCDLLDMEQQNSAEITSIRQESVKPQDAKIHNRLLLDYVYCIIKDYSELDLFSSKKERSKNVNIAIKHQLRKGCVINTIKITNGMEIQNIQIKYGVESTNTDIKNLLENIESNTETSMKNLLISNCQVQILSIILTSINKIMTSEIFSDVVHQSIQLSINSSISLRENSLELELSNLKMENIMSISSSQRYKCLGNSWTVDVIAHILSHLGGF